MEKVIINPDYNEAVTEQEKQNAIWDVIKWLDDNSEIDAGTNEDFGYDNDQTKKELAPNFIVFAPEKYRILNGLRKAYEPKKGVFDCQAAWAYIKTNIIDVLVEVGDEVKDKSLLKAIELFS